jgi:hypothetical protein
METLYQIARLIGQDALVVLSSPEMEHDILLPIGLLAVNKLKIDNLDFSTLADKWQMRIAFVDSQEVLLLTHESECCVITYDIDVKPELKDFRPSMLGIQITTDDIAKRVGPIFDSYIYSNLAIKAGLAFLVLMAKAGYFDYAPISELEKMQYKAEALRLTCTQDTIKELLTK